MYHPSYQRSRSDSAAGIVALVMAGALAMPAPSRSMSANFPIVVATHEGRLEGSSVGGVVSFKGIPFASAPVGSLRWRPPQPAAPWPGVRSARAFGPDCMQTLRPNPPPGASLSEDCLYLNIWRPAERTGRKLPVMVWIFGGGFVAGRTSAPVMDGSAFARRGVILVSVNYRLGRFGFFGFPALTQDRPRELKGNYAYMDQIAALAWVRRNIAAFGGDPGRVTLFGQSAGGESVASLLVSDQAKGLFQQTILQSSGSRSFYGGMSRLQEPSPGHPSAETIGVNFARSVGITGVDAEALARLRALPAEQLVAGVADAQGPAPTYSQPMIDGRIVVEDPRAAYLAGRAQAVPLLAGATSADLGQAKADSKQALLARFGSDSARAASAFDPSGDVPLDVLSTRVGGDQLMVEPARMLAAGAAVRGLKAYEYRFSYVPEARRARWPLGAGHGAEIAFVFDQLTAEFADPPQADRSVAATMNAYWVNFAKTGDPNGPGLPFWPGYQLRRDQLMDFGADGQARAVGDPRKERLDIVAGRQLGVSP